MPRTLTPAIRKSDALEAERKASPPRIPTREDVERMFAAKDAVRSRSFAYGWTDDEPLDGSDSVASDEARLADRRGA